MISSGHSRDDPVDDPDEPEGEIGTPQKLEHPPPWEWGDECDDDTPLPAKSEKYVRNPTQVMRTKHLAAQLHHFRQHVLDKTIKVEKIATAHQRADAFTKASPQNAFRSLRRTLIGW